MPPRESTAVIARKRMHLRRVLVVSFFFLSVLVALVCRMVQLTVYDRSFLKGQGDARSLRIQKIPAYRGMITDREGVPLAVSTPVESVWVNPQAFSPSKASFKKLCTLLHTSERTVSSLLKKAGDKEFVYLKRQLPPDLASQIKALDIPGVNCVQEFKRYYPEQDSAAQLVGFTNIDDRGIEGLELAFENWLKGVPGKRKIVKDRMGRIISAVGVLQPPQPGHDLVLSIDRRIQYLAYHELTNTIEQFSAKSGSVVVLDIKTGEILAIANAPSFNPNAREKYRRDTYRNKAITDLFEPGSVIKPFSIASALQSGLVKPTAIIDTRPSYMMVHGHMIRDIHNYGVLDVTGVLQHSSNVGVSKMVLLSPPEQFIDLLRRAGFAERTESAYPGEGDGFLVHPKDANPFVLATLSFGYGISTTALQLAKAYIAFANNGLIHSVTLLHNKPPEDPVRVMDEKTAKTVLNMLEAVVQKEGGTGQSARVPGYRIAGKTGTARIAGRHGYEDKRYIASFVGIAPASNPQVIVAVVIHEPTRAGYYAATVASPLFAKVMGGTLRLLDIHPDDVRVAL